LTIPQGGIVNNGRKTAVAANVQAQFLAKLPEALARAESLPAKR
jgi:hypothetical protein